MSTFDQAGIPNNFLERLARLEEAVRALQRRNVEAETLDELSVNLGDIEAGTIENVQCGNVMTRYVVPEGVTVSVPDDCVYLLPDKLLIDGTIYNNGKVYIL